ncbi:MAG: alpha/beta hydrolase [Deltaproteobacteria bacterium]|nr:alpha/beta hydrolase [Deltaproteobacteria bacterium]
MIKKNHFTCLVLVLIAMLYSPHLLAEECTIDSNFVDRGEKKEFIICGENIPSNYILTGLSDAHITVEYDMYLSTCAVGSKFPGIYLVLRAEEDATTATLTILNADTQEPVCEGWTIEVPDRVLIQEASLKGLSYPGPLKLPYIGLKIKSTSGIDISQACEEGLSFPDSKGPSLSLVSLEDLIKTILDIESSEATDQQLICCRESSIEALVRVQGQQRYLAKIIIPKVILEGGVEKEGVTYAALPPPPWISDMKDRDAKYIDVNGIRTRYFERGRGPNLVLVHGGQAGGTSNAQGWSPNFKYLSKYFHVYALDRIGQGYTENPKTEEDWEYYYSLVVDHVYEFIKAVGIKKTHIIGQSQGGWPVTRIALDHPEMVLSVVNMDSGMAPDEYLIDTIPWMFYMAAFVIPTKGNPTPESLQKESELWSYSLNNITEEGIQRSYEITQLPKTIEARKKMEEHELNPAHPSWIALKEQAMQEIEEGKLNVPSLVIWGHDDPAMPYEAGVALYEHITSSSDIPGSQLVVFEECGHSPYVEYPELFNRIIRSFCGSFSIPPVD